VIDTAIRIPRRPVRKNLLRAGERRCCPNGLPLRDQIITGTSPPRRFIDKDRPGRALLVQTIGQIERIVWESIENLPVKVMESALRPRLRATFSSRLNSALPAFSRTEFVAKDVATEDSTCARGR
jgi:hypothetical protein